MRGYGVWSRIAFATLTCPGRRGEGSSSVLRFEKAVSRVLGRALLGHRHLQPLDFRVHQRDALGEFLDRQQRQVLPDLMGDLFPRLVVVLNGHACSSVSK